MLKKSLRLTTKELEDVLKTGKVVHSPLFTLRYTAGQKSTKYAVVVAKKIISSSVGRHVAKRLMYDLLEPLITKMSIGIHAVVFMKSGSTEELQKLNKQSQGKGDSAEECVADLFKRARILI